MYQYKINLLVDSKIKYTEEELRKMFELEMEDCFCDSNTLDVFVEDIET